MTADDHTRPTRPDVTAAAARDHVRRLLSSAPGSRATSPTARTHASADIQPDAPSGTSTVLADALLVASELVANALRHGGGVASFTASLNGDTLRISVADRTVEAPRCKRSADEVLPGGHGWPLVQRLCRSVEIITSPGGKTIHASLSVV
ncbi:ATP-binding protein [Streptomyces sp. NPDC059017]|uniref:ATP-binding protein n=1 Tax=Streptomyces sp. NPDC059017 TaxID=3346700 RepID=UPI0036A4F51F